MKDIRRRLGSFAVLAIVVMPLLITVYLLFCSPDDLSARQTGKQRIFGATYMTMNNPYFQILDAPIQDSELAACSILSDNYQAGILCAKHLLSVRSSAKILMLEVSPAYRSCRQYWPVSDAGHITIFQQMQMCSSLPFFLKYWL